MCKVSQLFPKAWKRPTASRWCYKNYSILMQSSVYYFNDEKSFRDILNVFLLHCHSIRLGLLIGRYWNDLDSVSQWLIVNQWCHNGQNDIFFCPIKSEKQRCSYEARLSVAMNNCVEWTDDVNLYLSLIHYLQQPDWRDMCSGGYDLSPTYYWDSDRRM